MRKFLIPLLLASALVPAAAYAQDGGVRGHRSEGERDSSSNDRPQRVERAQRIERSGGGERAVQIERAERPVRTERNIQPVQSVEPVRQVRRIERDQTVEQGKQVRRTERDESVQPVQRARRTERNTDGFAIRRPPRAVQASPEPEVQVHRDGDRDGFSGLHDGIVRNGDRTDGHRRWNGDWRYDHRYDWRSYRSRYGSLYRFGRYYDPYGWNYRRWSIGFNLWPSYYGSSFWLNDPWQYRLPSAYGPYRWVRYYNDALLVDIYTGRVVDVVYNFFW